jgi:hypothetical protein
VGSFNAEQIRLQRGGEEDMKYTILRIYEVPADKEYEATDRMAEAVALHVEQQFHVKDIIREPGAKPGQGKAVDLKPPAGWLTLLRKQLTGKS